MHSHLRLSEQEAFEGLAENIKSNEHLWQQYSSAGKASKTELPSSDFFNINLKLFQKLLLFHCFQPTKLQVVLQLFVKEVLGERFIDWHSLDLNAVYLESTCCDPFLFILKSSYDSLSSIRHLAAKHQIDKENLKIYSMGQHRGSVELNAIDEAIKCGHWVILQNCHLAGEWMHRLERVCENLTIDTTHTDFRLWITSNSTATFPLSILHRCIKLVDEAPQHAQGILLKSFTTPPVTDENWIVSCVAPLELKRMLCSLNIFHAIIIERHNFGCIGWNYPYQFSYADFNIGIYQLFEIINHLNPIPFDILRNVLTECIYGSHMADPNDLRCLYQLSKYFFGPTIHPSGTLHVENLYPSTYTSIETITTFIKELSLDGGAYLCGLHDELNYIKDRNDSQFIFENLVVDKASNFIGVHTINKLNNKSFLDYLQKIWTANTWEDEQLLMVSTLANDLFESLPPPLQLEYKNDAIGENMDENGFDLILKYEVSKYNQLINTMHFTLTNVLDSLKGIYIHTTQGTLLKCFLPLSL